MSSSSLLNDDDGDGQQMHMQIDPKRLTCLVCDDAASGFHYNAMSCNGCKTFFRRTIINKRVYRCHKDGKCIFDKDFRCACRACRFKKCVDVGMTSTAIQFIMPPKKRKQRIKKMHIGQQQQITSSSSSPTSSSSLSSSSCGSSLDDLLQYLLRLETKCEQLRSSNITNARSLVDALTTRCATDDDLMQITEWSNHLSVYDRLRYWLLKDLTVAVEYAKSFDTISSLSLNDKCILLQQTGLVICSIVNSYASFDKGARTIIFPDGLMPFLDVPRQTSNRQQQLMIAQLIDPFIRLNVDRMQYVLLKATILFNPDCYGLSASGRDLLNSKRKHCLDALFAYMTNQYGACGPAKFGMLLTLSPTFFVNAEQHKQQLRVSETVSGGDGAHICQFIREMVLNKDVEIS